MWKEKIAREIKNLIPPVFNELFEREEKMYLVGGAIRDLYFGKEPVDFDFSVSDLSLAKEFLLQKGIKFFTLEKNKFVLLRALLDGKTFDFTVSSNVSSDISERDFTINTMFFDLKKGVFLENKTAEKDLENRILRLASPYAIQNDPVRSLRAVRFAGTFALMVNASDIPLIKKGFYMLIFVPKERKYEEAKRIFSMPFENVLMGFSALFPEKKAALFALKDGIAPCEEFSSLNKEINAGITYIDLCKLFLVTAALHQSGEAIYGMGERETKFLDLLENMHCDFDSLFETFYKYGLEKSVFASALLCGADTARKVLKWQSVSISGDEIKQKYGASGEEVGKIKKQLTKEECKKLYEKV
jgi:hypothetical protein